jgi:hypothetical protein
MPSSEPMAQWRAPGALSPARLALAAFLLIMTWFVVTRFGLDGLVGSARPVDLRLGLRGMSVVDRANGELVFERSAELTRARLRDLGARLGDGEWSPMFVPHSHKDLFFSGRVRLVVDSKVSVGSLLDALRKLADPQVGLWRYDLVCDGVQVQAWVIPQVKANDNIGAYADLLLYAVRAGEDGQVVSDYEVCDRATADGKLIADRAASIAAQGVTLDDFEGSLTVAAETGILARDLIRHLSALGLESTDLELQLLETSLEQ